MPIYDSLKSKLIIFASYDMVHQYVQYYGHGLTILQVWRYGNKYLWLYYNGP
jgi:hypothetical protein